MGLISRVSSRTYRLQDMLTLQLRPSGVRANTKACKAIISDIAQSELLETVLQNTILSNNSKIQPINTSLSSSTKQVASDNPASTPESNSSCSQNFLFRNF